MKATGQEALVGTGPGKADIGRLLQYALSLPITSAVVGMPTLEYLREDVKVAANFQPMPAEEMQRFSKELAGANKQAMDHRFLCHVDA